MAYLICLKIKQIGETYWQQTLTGQEAFAVHEVIHRSGGKLTLRVASEIIA